MKKLEKFWRGMLLIGCGSIIFLPQTSSAADPLVTVLTSRHIENVTPKSLEKIAGGEDPLVSRLLELRHDDSVPGLSVRATKFLVAYSDRADVQAALESDIGDLRKHSTANVLALGLDDVRDSGARVRFAKSLLVRADRDKNFRTYARQLGKSSDPAVKSLARSLAD